MTIQATTQSIGTAGRKRRAVLASLALGAALAASVALAGGTARQAEGAVSEKIVFASNRTTGKGVVNPTGDREIFVMNPNGTGAKQLTFNAEHDVEPILSPDGTRIAFMSKGDQTSNPEGDWEVYVMNVDGSGKKNLSDNGSGVDDVVPDFSPDGTKIAYQSWGAQSSNPEGDSEVYVMNVQDGSDKTNLSNTYLGIFDYDADFSPNGTKIAYTSYGNQESNSDGDIDIFVMNADGSGQKNLTNDGSYASDVYPHFSPDGQKIAYTSSGGQASNPEGDSEVYVMNASDGSGQNNLTNTGSDVQEQVPQFSTDGRLITFQSSGVQTSNPEGEPEVYAMNALDGSGKKNLTNNGSGINEVGPVFSPDGTKIAYMSRGVQGSNPEGDWEIYRMSASDGTGKKNLSDNAAEYDESPEWGR